MLTLILKTLRLFRIRIAPFKEIDYTHVVAGMYEEGAYARASGWYIHGPEWSGVTIMVLRWRPRLERNEGGRYN